MSEIVSFTGASPGMKSADDPETGTIDRNDREKENYAG